MDEWNTVGSALLALFPKGTDRKKSANYDNLPLSAEAIFGAAAYLIDRGGVYHRIVPFSEISSGKQGETLQPEEWEKSNLLVSSKTIANARDIGERWRCCAADVKRLAAAGETASAADAEETLKFIFEEVRKIWAELVSCHELKIVERPLPKKPIDWWLPAFKLLIIADEASRDSGFGSQDFVDQTPLESMIRSAVPADRPYYRLQDNPAHVVHKDEATTIAVGLNEYLARVVPKSRTPSVGCTMRTLSQNLALVPASGAVDVCWYRLLRPFPNDRGDGKPLNLLLVPFPYHVKASAFREVNRSGQNPKKRWGSFTIDQTWLDPGKDEKVMPDKLADFLIDLIDAAERDVGSVHGVVLPEYALDWACYARLVDRLQRRYEGIDGAAPRSIDFIVSGLSSTNERPRGNYVAATTFSLDDDGICFAATNYRSKHHRWQLTAPQIAAYALGSALDPNILWWEAMELPKRSIGLNVFRKNAVFSAMICEDLARSEPCHEPLRAVGPNLVFVILMDGPQVSNRWSARYATTLADDPGSSVLTLTSLALIERANKVGTHDPSRTVALWRDDRGETVHIACPKDAQGVLITLSGTPADDTTLDGRTNLDTQAWRYRGHQPVRLADDTRASYKHLLDDA